MVSFVKYCLLVSLFLLTINADIANWAGGNGDFFDVSNWEEGIIPNGTNFDVVFGTDGSNIFLSSPLTVNSISLTNGVFIVNETTLTLNYLYITSTINITNSQLIPLNSSNTNITVSTPGVVNIKGSNCTIPIMMISSTLILQSNESSFTTIDTFGNSFININVDGNFDYLSLSDATSIIIFPPSRLTIDSLDFLKGTISSNGTTGAQIWINELNWFSGDISDGVTLKVSGDSSFQTSNKKTFFNMVTFQNDGTLLWGDGIIQSTNNNTFINYGTIMSSIDKNNNNSVTCTFNSLDLSTFKNWGTVDCSDVPYVYFSGWDVYSWNKWIGNFYHSSSGSVWFNDGTSISGYIDLSENDNGVYTFDTSFVFTNISANAVTLQVNRNIKINYLKVIGGSVLQSSSSEVGYQVKDSLIIGEDNNESNSFQNTNLVIESSCVSYFNAYLDFMHGKLVNYGTWTWYSTDTMYITGSTVINNGTINCIWDKTFLDVQSSTSELSYFYNYGIFNVNTQNGGYVRFHDNTNFTQCGEGTLSFYVTDPTSSPSASFENEVLNLDGKLQINFDTSSTVSGITSDGMTVVKFKAKPSMVDDPSFVIFNGGIGSSVETVNDPDVTLSTCWTIDSVGNGKGVVYTSDKVPNTCLTTSLSSSCPTSTPSGPVSPSDTPVSTPTLPTPSIPTNSPTPTTPTEPLTPSAGHMIYGSILSFFVLCVLI